MSTILSYTVSKLVHFLRHNVEYRTESGSENCWLAISLNIRSSELCDVKTQPNLEQYVRAD